MIKTKMAFLEGREKTGTRKERLLLRSCKQA